MVSASHFLLDLLSAKLSESHPVARVDAWADDTGNEPTVSIMAAIEETLEPYLDEDFGKGMSEKLGAVRRNILPIVAKGAAGAFSKAFARYVGEAVREEIAALIDAGNVEGPTDDKPKSQEPVEAEIGGDGAESAIDTIGASLVELGDKHAKEMIADYRKRKASRETFKSSMKELVETLSKRDGSISPPLIVIVDELDRCRPDYAIKVIEEIKHFFDVPRVAFVLALNRDQLARSVKAVYGAEFKSDEYLRRFFDFSLGLTDKSFSALIANECAQFRIDKDDLRSPPIQNTNENSWDDHNRHITLILNGMNANAREAKETIRNLALFLDTWPYPTRIELTLAIPLLLSKIRGGEAVQANIPTNKLEHYSPYFDSVPQANFADLFRGMNECATESLINSRNGLSRGHFANAYIRLVFSEEFAQAQLLFGQEGRWHVPVSFAAKYRKHIDFLHEITVD